MSNFYYDTGEVRTCGSPLPPAYNYEHIHYPPRSPSYTPLSTATTKACGSWPSSYIAHGSPPPLPYIEPIDNYPPSSPSYTPASSPSYMPQPASPRKPKSQKRRMALGIKRRKIDLDGILIKKKQ